MADGREHALDLVLAALVQRELDPRWAEQAGLRRRGRAVAAPTLVQMYERMGCVPR